MNTLRKIYINSWFTLISKSQAPLVCFFLLSLACTQLEASERLRLGTLVPKGSSYFNHLKQMEGVWKQAPGGGVAVSIYPDGRLGGEAEMVRRMRGGQIQVGLLTVAGLAEIEPRVVGLQQAPMIFRSIDEVEHVMQELGKDLEIMMEQKGFKVLGWTHAGWVHFFAKEPVQTIDDVRAAKLFCWAGSPEIVEIFQHNGFRPVPLETKDIVPGLQTGMITCVPMPPMAANFSQVDTRAPYMLKVNWGALAGGLVMTKEAWDKLTPEQGKHLLAAALKATESIQADGLREAEESIKAMQQRGLKVIEPTGPQLDQWYAETAKAYPEIRERVTEPAIFDRVNDILKNYRNR